MKRCKLTTSQLIRYLDSALDEAEALSVSHHVKGCVACQRRVRELAQAQARFGAKLRGNDCPSTMLLGEYHLRYAALDEARSMRKHLTNCSRCLKRLNEIASQISEQADLPIADIPPRGYRLPPQIIYPELAPSFLAQGIRGDIAEATVNYSWGGGKVSLRLQHDPNGLGNSTLGDTYSETHDASHPRSRIATVTGLLLGLEHSFAKVRLLSVAETAKETTTDSPTNNASETVRSPGTGREVANAAINRLGGFRLESISGGTYELQLEAEDGSTLMLRELNI